MPINQLILLRFGKKTAFVIAMWVSHEGMLCVVALPTQLFLPSLLSPFFFCVCVCVCVCVWVCVCVLLSPDFDAWTIDALIPGLLSSFNISFGCFWNNWYFCCLPGAMVTCMFLCVFGSVSLHICAILGPCFLMWLMQLHWNMGFEEKSFSIPSLFLETNLVLELHWQSPLVFMSKSNGKFYIHVQLHFIIFCSIISFFTAKFFWLNKKKLCLLYYVLTTYTCRLYMYVCVC